MGLFQKGNLQLNRHEVSGSLGDLGTFIPLFLGMVTVNGLLAGPVLIFAGLFNILTGIAFGIPMAVQPMKAIATIAITERLSVPEILAAGIVTSFIILVLGATGLISWIGNRVPKAVVRGLQLGIGLQLAIVGLKMISGTHQVWGADSITMGILGGLLVLLLLFSRRLPGALILFAFGLVLLTLKSPGVWKAIGLTPSLPQLIIPGLQDFWTGAWKAAVPQIPLTMLNSVLAVSALSWDLFPKRGANIRPVAISVGLMNLIGCWFGAMPMCHGAGGLAGQYRFGARTGGSVVFLGAFKVLLGVLFGAAVVALMVVYPKSILGVLLIFSSVELALVVRDMHTRAEYFIVLATTAPILAMQSTGIGFLVGLVVGLLFQYGVARLERLEEEPQAPPHQASH
ncbi:MAG: sulfate transporter [Chloroflexi bacterium]|nr:sulfate transporter [Chloroflexota bacterium]